MQLVTAVQRVNCELRCEAVEAAAAVLILFTLIHLCPADQKTLSDQVIDVVINTMGHRGRLIALKVDGYHCGEDTSNIEELHGG